MKVAIIIINFNNIIIIINFKENTQFIQVFLTSFS